MAIARIPGYSLISDLDRQGTELQFTTNGNALVYMDFVNFRLGVNTSAPTQALEVNGNVLVANGHIYTSANLTYDIGSLTNYWNTVYAGNIVGTLLTSSQPNITSVGTLSNLTVTGDFIAGNINLANLVINGNSIIDAGNNRIINVATPTANTDAASKVYVDSAISTNKGNTIALGTPTDGNLTSPGAYAGWSTVTTVTDAIDDLNEMMENVRANTFVKSVTFSSNTTAGGAGTTVLLTFNPTGNPNRYDISWGDGTWSNSVSTSTTTHTYSDNTNSPFDVYVRAYNNSGAGTGSEATAIRVDYIVIYTADPVMSFAFYKSSTGGSALSGNDIWVTEGDTFWLKNNTTNTTMATVAYQANFGDGAGNTSIASDSADGGVLGNRLAYTYGYSSSSGSSTNAVRLYLTSHTTANPGVIPMSTAVNLKVYDANISAPSGLSSKTISFSGSVGTSPYLAASFTDNTGGATTTAGSSVSRTVATGTTPVTTVGTAATSYAYNANVGNISAVFNGSNVSTVNIATITSATISGNIGFIALSDYWLLTSAGASTTFASSTYSPGRFYGFEANVVRTGGSIPTGLNSYQLYHSTTGATNKIEFVKDDLTSAPTTTVGNLSVRTAGTYRYISGIPYFNTGSPTLWMNGVTISNFIGQTYNNTSNVVFIASGTNQEGTSSAVITATGYTYANISNSSASMLSGGIPIAGTGQSSAYTIANLSVPVTASSVRSIANISTVTTNVNGTGTASQNNTTRIAVHSAAQSGISEIAIAVSDALGSGFYLDDGIRSFYFNAATTVTPSYVSGTSFYTSDVYTESSDPGVAGTKEATVRLGVIRYDVNNYSSGYLPVGPNRSGDTGTQYFTFVFRRRVVSNFDINITSATGVSGVWIAAPGTTIDSASTLNGWIDPSTTYAGAGVPGANTGAGGNGSNGCAFTSGDRIQANVALSGGYTMTLGSENMTNATGNCVLVRIALQSGQSVTALSIGVAA